MKTTQNEKGSITREIEFNLTPEEFEPYRHAKYAEAQKKLKLKGFRPGKVPINIVKKLHGAELDKEAAEDAVQKSFASYAQERELQPFGTPHVMELDINKEGGLDYTIEYEVLPEFELQDFKGLQARKIYHVVTPDEVDEELEWLRQRNRKEEVVETIADEEHVAVADFQKLDESGAPLIGEVSRDIPVTLNSERINPELKEKMIGRKMDETVNIALPTGEDGDTIPYQLTIKEVKQIVLPELDEEFAQKMLGEDDSDIEDLKDSIKQSIEAQYDAQYERVFRDSLIDQLIDKHEFEVPKSLVGHVLNSFLEEEKRKLGKEDLPEDFPIQQFFVQREPEARRIAKWLMVRDRMIDEQNIEATDEDIEALARMDAERHGMDPDAVIDVYKKNEEVPHRIQAEKVLQLLVDYAEVTDEIEDKEWQKEQEELKEKAAQAASEAQDEATAEPVAESSGGDREDDDTTD